MSPGPAAHQPAVFPSSVRKRTVAVASGLGKPKCVTTKTALSTMPSPQRVVSTCLLLKNGLSYLPFRKFSLNPTDVISHSPLNLLTCAVLINCK